jgi:hypothetical protein
VHIEAPDDADLLAAAGWDGTPSAHVLAKAVTNRFCAAAIDVNGGLGAPPYETIEFFVCSSDGRWTTAGDGGGATAGASGWHDGYAFACGESVEDEVIVTFDGDRHGVQTTNGWWMFAGRQDRYDPAAGPSRVE